MDLKDIAKLARTINKTVNVTKDILQQIGVTDEDGSLTPEGHNYTYDDGDGLEFDGNVVRAARSYTGVIDWYCDCCNCYMNNQPGFNTLTGHWTCTKCGEDNDVSDNNIEWE